MLTVIFGYVGGILSLQRQRELKSEGKEHPFVPLTIINQQPTAQASGGGETPLLSNYGSKAAVVMGKVPDDWKVKKDKKKGKW